jgi:hypothetical protein
MPMPVMGVKECLLYPIGGYLFTEERKLSVLFQPVIKEIIIDIVISIMVCDDVFFFYSIVDGYILPSNFS